jgi:hypothetical protein
MDGDSFYKVPRKLTYRCGKTAAPTRFLVSSVTGSVIVCIGFPRVSCPLRQVSWRRRTRVNSTRCTPWGGAHGAGGIGLVDGFMCCTQLGRDRTLNSPFPFARSRYGASSGCAGSWARITEEAAHNSYWRIGPVASVEERPMMSPGLRQARTVQCA